jgi:hypothetical protein
MTAGGDIGTWFNLPDDFEIADAEAADRLLLDC